MTTDKERNAAHQATSLQRRQAAYHLTIDVANDLGYLEHSRDRVGVDRFINDARAGKIVVLPAGNGYDGSDLEQVIAGVSRAMGAAENPAAVEMLRKLRNALRRKQAAALVRKFKPPQEIDNE